MPWHVLPFWNFQIFLESFHIIFNEIIGPPLDGIMVSYNATYFLQLISQPVSRWRPVKLRLSCEVDKQTGCSDKFSKRRSTSCLYNRNHEFYDFSHWWRYPNFQQWDINRNWIWKPEYQKLDKQKPQLLVVEIFNIQKL